jgi:acetyl-CoA C-acetyltransferase
VDGSRQRSDDWRTPILVGSGQITQREPDPRAALNAMDLTAAAASKAAADARDGAALLRSLDALVMLRSFSDTSWHFKSSFGGPTNPLRSVANRLNLSNVTHLIYTHPGGNMPQWCIKHLFEMRACCRTWSSAI